MRQNWDSMKIKRHSSLTQNTIARVTRICLSPRAIQETIHSWFHSHSPVLMTLWFCLVKMSMRDFIHIFFSPDRTENSSFWAGENGIWIENGYFHYRVLVKLSSTECTSSPVTFHLLAKVLFKNGRVLVLNWRASYLWSLSVSNCRGLGNCFQRILFCMQGKFSEKVAKVWHGKCWKSSRQITT